ncbi:hypothetical protein N7452_004306 [Penicillium brevicompactum]|uniref:Zn(2)-C6 fungal-type domain-containing protein n=1 Tax=Penicillium brevicompactum TaxID=5074 RepID=A0A9W9UE30_PENBR|nr:hypothetical protein N7452_004306 [Penicillium brevicompactum]
MSAADDNYTIHKVSLKRTRQACGPCRRKKARCPGEKPTCSLCQRLKQSCSYEPQTSTRAKAQKIATAPTRVQPDAQGGDAFETEGDVSSSGRLQRIEERLDLMTQLLQQGSSASQLSREESSDAQPTDHYEEHVPYNGLETITSPEDELIAPQQDHLSSPSIEKEIEKEIELYLTYVHDQPYCVFSKEWLLKSQDNLPPEIALPLVALTSRLPRRSCETLFGDRPSAKYFAKRPGKCCPINIDVVDFSDGKAHRGYASVALGLRAIQSASLNRQHDAYRSRKDPMIEARKRITWAFFMLDRTYCASRNYSLSLSDKQFTLPFPAPEPETLTAHDLSSTQGSLHDGPGKQGQKVDHGVLACLLRLYSLWGKTTEWVFEPFAENILPPWQTGSALAILESGWLQFETHFADAHRYINVDFKRRAREEPESRTYLSTWVCVQFLFHTIQCLLHHPFVIMTKLRNFNGNISATFLQKSFETSLLHSRWIVRFIREMSEVGFEVCDPFLGYLAAIAATIQLEHTGNKNPQIAILVNKEFRTLVDFITELSVHWENMSILVSQFDQVPYGAILLTPIQVSKVNELAARHQNYGSLYYNQEGFSGALSKMPTPSSMPRMSTEDEALMWEILDFGCSSENNAPGKIGDLAVPHPNAMEPGKNTSTMVQGITGLSDNGNIGRSESQNIRDHGPPAFDSISDPTGQSAFPGWPFNTRSGDVIGPTIPDIPDWMILGDYMAEHL